MHFFESTKHIKKKNLASFTACEGIAFCSYNEILILIFDYYLLSYLATGNRWLATCAIRLLCELCTPKGIVHCGWEKSSGEVRTD